MIFPIEWVITIMLLAFSAILMAYSKGRTRGYKEGIEFGTKMGRIDQNLENAQEENRFWKKLAIIDTHRKESTQSEKTPTEI